MLDGADLDNALDGRRRLHRPEVAVHGRAQPSMRGARRRRRPGARARPRTPSPALRRAALVHDFGTTAVPNSIWDKPGPLTRAEFDRVELHPMLTEQMLRRSPALAALNPVASAHHEKCDGSGYHKRVRADADDLGACVLAATEIYVGLTTERADRPPFSRRGRRRRASPARIRRRARASREPRRARGRGPRRAASARGQAAAAIRAGSPVAKSTCCASRRRGLTTRADRRSALHLAQDRRSPHPAHLRQDRRLDTSRRRAVGHATRRRPQRPPRRLAHPAPRRHRLAGLLPRWTSHGVRAPRRQGRTPTTTAAAIGPRRPCTGRPAPTTSMSPLS